jgi:histidine triad (HIT) family protein
VALPKRKYEASRQVTLSSSKLAQTSIPTFKQGLRHTWPIFWGRKAASKGKTDMAIDATQPYDDDNIFARILRGEIPCSKVYEDEHVLAFHDINPLAPSHMLVIPKGRYVSWDDFAERGSAEEIAALVRAAGRIARDAELVGTGYRLLANVGGDGGQEVPHFHLHIFGGRPLGPMLAR